MTRPLTLAIAGDVMLGRLVASALAERGWAPPWGELLPVVEDADLFLINLECALTELTQPCYDKVFHFRVDPAAATTLQRGRVAFASLANNHTADFGLDGLVETIRTLDRAGIRHAGAGASLGEARAPARLTAAGWRVAVVACADHPAEWAATPSTPGISHVPVPDGIGAVREVLAEARRDADLVVFSIHWGPNMRERPTPWFRDFARSVVEAGADVFWGHSAHVTQGIEVWRGKPILYDTGDFVDDYRVDPALRNDLSALFLLRARPPQIERLEVLPVEIGDRRVRRARGAARDRFVQRFTRLCAEMGTTVRASPGADSLSVAPSGGEHLAGTEYE
jgi:poly-gamma-glutamate capsule biosynthesis protein CapA/YwtB (metallophosphatase superfamily)